MNYLKKAEKIFKIPTIGLVGSCDCEICKTTRETIIKKLSKLLLDFSKELGVDIVNKKFPRGEREWCIQCARRIKKYQKEKAVKLLSVKKVKISSKLVGRKHE